MKNYRFFSLVRGAILSVVFLASGPTLNADASDKDGQALLTAITDEHFPEALRLIANGANVNVRSAKGYTPLYLATLYDKADVIRSLIGHGADVNARCIHGSSPIHAACSFGGLATVKYLIQLGANVNARENGGATPLHETVMRNRKNAPEVVRLLVENGADVDARDDDGLTSVDMARKEHFDAMARLLLQLKDEKLKEKAKFN